MRLEKGHLRELRHDFRAYYRVPYDDVATDEAVDLILSLPQGSRYRAALDPGAAWSGERHQMADVLDVLLVINWRLMGCPQKYQPAPAERPGDRERRIGAAKKAQTVRSKIEKTRWEEA